MTTIQSQLQALKSPKAARVPEFPAPRSLSALRVHSALRQRPVRAPPGLLRGETRGRDTAPLANRGRLSQLSPLRIRKLSEVSMRTSDLAGPLLSLGSLGNTEGRPGSPPLSPIKPRVVFCLVPKKKAVVVSIGGDQPEALPLRQRTAPRELYSPWPRYSLNHSPLSSNPLSSRA